MDEKNKEEKSKNIVVEKEDKKSKKVIILILGIIFFTIISMLIAGNFEKVKDILSPDIDSAATNWKGPENENDSLSRGIAIPGYESMKLRANKLDQKVSIYNPEENNCYFVITLCLPNGTEIYKSKMIEPGKGLYNIVLNQKIQKGIYENSILKYECFAMDESLSELNGASVNLKLEVK